MALARELSRFFGVGVAATLVDYGTMIAVRQGLGVDPAFAALAGYCCGGALSYALNRRHTFTTERSHLEAGWRFAAVMAVGFTLTGLGMGLFADTLHIPYVPARMITSGLVFCWNFVAHKWWTFGEGAA